MPKLTKLGLGSLVLGLIGLALVLPWFLATMNQTNQTLKQLKSLREAENVVPAPKPPVSAPVMQTAPKPVATPLPVLAESPVIKQQLAGPPPKPQAHWYASKALEGRTAPKTNADFRPDQYARMAKPAAQTDSGPYLIVDVPTGPHSDLDVRDTIKRLKQRDNNCGVFPFQPKPGKTVHRIHCSG